MSASHERHLTGPYSLESLGGRHTIDNLGNEHFSVSQSLPYPEKLNAPLGNVLLSACSHEPELEGLKCYNLPADYLPFGAVLNEAFSSESDRADLFVRFTFYNIGHELLKIEKSGQGIPKPFSYRQVLILRNVVGFKLLPPVTMVEDANSIRAARGNLIDRLSTELDVNSGTESRRIRMAANFRFFMLGLDGEPYES